MPAPEPKRFWTNEEMRAALERNGAYREHDKSKEPGLADNLAAIAMVEGARYTHPDTTDFYETGDVKLANEKEGNKTWGPSVTSFQIRTYYEDTGKGTDRDREWLMASMDNACQAAIRIATRGRKLNAWTTYRNGRYQAYLQDFDMYAPGPGEYIVVSGDTLERIDKKLGLPEGFLRKYNNDPYLLIKMHLKLPYVDFVAKSGDTLAKFMKRPEIGFPDEIFNNDLLLKMGKLAGMKDPADLRVGDKIRVYRADSLDLLEEFVNG